VTAASHLLFNIVDSWGVFCRETPPAQTIPLDRAGAESKPITFQTGAMCQPTSILLQRGANYRLTITVTSPWVDNNIGTDPAGHGTTSRPGLLGKLKLMAALPMRRVLFRPWFMLLGRIGSTGTAEVFLDPSPVAGRSFTYEAAIRRAERGGELLLYVNDAGIPLPWIYDLFYRNNLGTAEIVVRRTN
jgi:hypothetical protein